MESETHKLFVGGILWDTREEDLKQYFSRYGAVLGAVVPRDKIYGTPRCFGFVWFADSDSADRALEDTHIIRGRTVDVKRAVPKHDQHQIQQQQQSLYHGEAQDNNAVNGERSSINSTINKIFVGGLPPSLTNEEFASYFEQFGQIKDAVVMREGATNRPRGFGFVTFDSEDSYEKVIQNRFHELNNKQVEVKPAIPKGVQQDSNTHEAFRYGYGRGSVYHNGSYPGQYPFPVVGVGSHFPPHIPAYNGGLHDPSQVRIYPPQCRNQWNNWYGHGPHGFIPAAYGNNPSYGLNTNIMIYHPNVNYGVYGTSGGTNGRFDGLGMNQFRYMLGGWHPNGNVQDPQVNRVGEMNAEANQPDSARTTNGEICNSETESTNEQNGNSQNTEKSPIEDNAAKENGNSQNPEKNPIEDNAAKENGNSQNTEKNPIEDNAAKENGNSQNTEKNPIEDNAAKENGNLQNTEKNPIEENAAKENGNGQNPEKNPIEDNTAEEAVNGQNPEKNPIEDNTAEEAVNDEADPNVNGHVDKVSAQVNSIKLADDESRTQKS